MTLTSELDLDILSLDLHAKTQVRMSDRSAGRHVGCNSKNNCGGTFSILHHIMQILHPMNLIKIRLCTGRSYFPLTLTVPQHHGQDTQWKTWKRIQETQGSSVLLMLDWTSSKTVIVFKVGF